MTFLLPHSEAQPSTLHPRLPLTNPAPRWPLTRPGWQESPCQFLFLPLKEVTGVCS